MRLADSTKPTAAELQRNVNALGAKASY